MKNKLSFFISVSILFFFISACNNNQANQANQEEQTVKMMSYNIRYDNPGDSLNNWNYRKKQLVNEVLFYNPDFMGIQEGLVNQVQYLSKHLTDRKYIGVGRKDGKEGGEYSAIFYNAKKYSLIAGSDSTIWLSETPEKPSVGWDAVLPRILTWGKFKSNETGKIVYVFNTHYDHIGDTARANSSKLIVNTIKKIAQGEAAILSGDFNVTRDRKPYKIIKNSFMNDAFKISKLPPIGPKFTFAGFEVCKGASHGNRIDYIFVNNKFKVQKAATISNMRNGHFLSDHLPILSVLEWVK